jgi:hypothetical protein
MLILIHNSKHLLVVHLLVRVIHNTSTTEEGRDSCRSSQFHQDRDLTETEEERKELHREELHCIDMLIC